MNLSRLIYCLLAAAVPCASAWAGGDPVNGQKLYAVRCIACHTIDASVAGPAHRGVFGRKAGSVAGFDYSPALKASRIVWTEKNLDRWLSNPEQVIPGQRMFYSVGEASERADLIAYLKTQHR